MMIKSGRWRIGPENGRLLLRTGRKGVGSTVGHDLTIEVTDWSAQVDIPDSGATEASVTARVELGSLAVRAGTGGARPLSDKDRAEIESNAGRTLAVERYPTATFESTEIHAENDRAAISGTLRLHGRTAPLELDVAEVGPSRYRGTAVVTQSAYGVKPYSALLGALRVRDDVEVEINVDLVG